MERLIHMNQEMALMLAHIIIMTTKERRDGSDVSGCVTEVLTVPLSNAYFRLGAPQQLWHCNASSTPTSPFYFSRASTFSWYLQVSSIRKTIAFQG